MVRQKCVCLLLVLLSPILYPICWWPMRFTGWMFWTEPNDIMYHLWHQMVSIFDPKPKMKTWIYILFISAIAYIPYWMIWKIVNAVWIVYFK